MRRNMSPPWAKTSGTRGPFLTTNPVPWVYGWGVKCGQKGCRPDKGCWWTTPLPLSPLKPVIKNNEEKGRKRLVAPNQLLGRTTPPPPGGVLGALSLRPGPGHQPGVLAEVRHQPGLDPPQGHSPRMRSGRLTNAECLS